MGVVAKLEKPPKRIVNVNGDTVFFPSYSETFDQGLLDAKKLAANDYCQSCHPDSFHEWQRSAHRFSSFNNPVLPEERRADGGPRRARADEVVLGVPRPGRPLHGTDGRGDAGEVLLRFLGGAAGPDLHVLPFDRRDQGPARQRLLRHRGVEAVPVRLLEEQDARGDQPAADPDGAFPSPQDVPEAVPPDAGVLLDLPQGRADPGAQQLPVDARAGPLRHLVRLGSLRPRRALLLRPAAAEGLPRLPPASVPLRRVRQQEGAAARPPLPRRQHGPALHPGGQGDAGARSAGSSRTRCCRSISSRSSAATRRGRDRRGAAGGQARRDPRPRGRRADARRRAPVHQRHRRLQRDVGFARGRRREARSSSGAACSTRPAVSIPRPTRSRSS